MGTHTSVRSKTAPLPSHRRKTMTLAESAALYAGIGRALGFWALGLLAQKASSSEPEEPSSEPVGTRRYESAKPVGSDAGQPMWRVEVKQRDGSWRSMLTYTPPS